MAVVNGYRACGVRVGRELEQAAREHSGLHGMPLSALLRVGLATLAGLPLNDSLAKYVFDPGSKRYQDLEHAFGDHSETVLSTEIRDEAVREES